MEEAIKVLEHSEVVLMKKIKVMKDGKPKYAASERLNELRHAIAVLRAHNEMGAMLEQEEDAILAEQFTQHPPRAKA
jgi:hypothetical protein